LQANIKQDIHHILKKHWGHDSFRPLQEDIISAVLEKKDVLALLPTGGGKSVCFQVPGLVLGGSTLVISPLVALMNDQVENLRSRGISAVAITAQMNARQIGVALNNAALGHVQFLYVSPERLQNENFRQSLSYLPVSLIAVDEAHCISQWGYDFRPSYLKIAELRAYFPQVKIIALTASATKEVVEDIQVKLQFKDQKVFRQSFSRPNLRYVVQKEDNKTERLLKIIKNIGGSGVVYVRNRKKTVEIANWLIKQSVTASSYHAGLKYEDRQKVQKGWIENKVQVICATNAFGMGIDKPDVRFVVHLDLPESLEAYFQEAGRAGRDGKPAYCVLLVTGSDQQKLLDDFKRGFPDVDYIRQTYQAISNYFQVAVGAGEGLSFEFDISRVCASYNLQPVLVFNSIKFMEKENLLSLIDVGYEPSKVMMLAGREQIYEMQLRSPKFEALLKTMLRSYGGLFDDYVFVNEAEIARRIKTGSVAVATDLAYLDKQGILSYVPRSDLPRLLYLQDRINTKFLTISPENYAHLKQRQQDRIRSVISYSDNNALCRQVQLLQYFNEHNFTDCGHCDVCIANKPRDYGKVKSRIRGLLQERALTLLQLKQEMRSVNDKTWTTAFNELLDDGLVEERNEHYVLKK
jgi:ATP-dependent DNA helicase RecQ